MKILHVLNDSLPSLCGYTIRSATIVQFQSELGLDPVVLTSPHHEAPVNGEVELIREIRHHRCSPRVQKKFPVLHEIDVINRMAKRADEVVRQEQPDLIHAHSPCLWGVAALRVARRRKLPFVYEIRGFWEDAAVDQKKTTETSLKYRLSRWLETRVVRQADVVTTIAQQLKDDLVQRGINPDKIFLVPNGVNTDRFVAQDLDQTLINELRLQDRARFGFIGSLYPWEGVEHLIRAVPRVVTQIPNAHCLIIGGGPQDAMLRDLITQLDLNAYVTLTGSVPYDQILRYYSIMDVLVYPRISTRNTEMCTPLKPLEAMAMQKAVLGSSVGGIRELMPNGVGLQCQPGNSQDIAAKCVQLLSQPELRNKIGRAAKDCVTRQRDWKNIVQRYVEVYETAIQRCKH